MADTSFAEFQRTEMERVRTLVDRDEDPVEQSQRQVFEARRARRESEVQE